MVMLSYHCSSSRGAVVGFIWPRIKDTSCTLLRSLHSCELCYCHSLTFHTFLPSPHRDAGDSLNDCRIILVDEIYKIEEPGSACPLTAPPAKRECCVVLVCLSLTLGCSDCLCEDQRSEGSRTPAVVPPLSVSSASWCFLEPERGCGFFLFTGRIGPVCKACKDNPNKTCRICACHICGGKQDPEKQLMCDECDMAFHIYCLNPPLSSIPDDEDW